MSDKKELLTVQDWEDAITVQDACNLSGVVFAFAKVMEKICNDPANTCTEWKNSHPICIMYASKIASLTGCDFSFASAYQAVKDEIGRLS